MSNCIIISYLTTDVVWIPPGTGAAAIDNYVYDDRNACEKGYNATAALAGPSMLKDTGPFHLAVEVRSDLSLFSIYFSGCGRVFR